MDMKRRRGLQAGLCSAVAALLLGGCAAEAPLARQQEAEASLREAQARYGIRIEGLQLSAAGAMLDFRYRVVDPVRAAPLLDPKLQPYLLDEARGARLGVPVTPVLGRIRQTSRNNQIHTDRSYFVLFGNPGKAVQSGDKVSLLLGQVKITDLTVR